MQEMRIPGPRKEPRGRAHRGRNRWSTRELLCGADRELTRRKNGLKAATLSEWREAFWRPARGLRIWQEDLVDEQSRRMKSVIANLTMDWKLSRAHPPHGGRAALFTVDGESIHRSRSGFVVN